MGVRRLVQSASWTKTNQHVEVVKPKARIVEVGNQQKDTGSTSWTRSLHSGKLLESGDIAVIMLQCDLKPFQLNVKKTCAQSEMDENMHLGLPQGCEERSENIVRLSKTPFRSR